MALQLSYKLELGIGISSKFLCLKEAIIEGVLTLLEDPNYKRRQAELSGGGEGGGGEGTTSQYVEKALCGHGLWSSVSESPHN